MKPKPAYRITSISEDVYELYHGELTLAKFSRANFREIMEKVASEWNFSTNWIGSILRLLNRTYPLKPAISERTDFDRFVDKLGTKGIAEYMRSKGFRVVAQCEFDDMRLIRFLERSGYHVEGFVGDVHYSSDEVMNVR